MPQVGTARSCPAYWCRHRRTVEYDMKMLIPARCLWGRWHRRSYWTCSSLQHVHLVFLYSVHLIMFDELLLFDTWTLWRGISQVIPVLCETLPALNGLSIRWKFLLWEKESWSKKCKARSSNACISLFQNLYLLKSVVLVILYTYFTLK